MQCLKPELQAVEEVLGACLGSSAAVQRQLRRVSQLKALKVRRMCKWDGLVGLRVGS